MEQQCRPQRTRTALVTWALTGLACVGEVSRAPGAPESPSVPGGPPPASGPPVVSLPPLPRDVDPGRVTAHRLNRTEYDNTVRDLLGTSSRPAQLFPVEDSSFGYDNIADALRLTPVQFDLYDKAAEALAAEAAGALARGTPPPALAPVLVCELGKEGLPCVRRVLGKLAERAWRRPLTPEETSRLHAVVDGARALGLEPQGQLTTAIHVLLLAPQFLFRFQIDANPRPRALDDYELASRLSYFLWSSMPDEALLAAAAEKRLANELGAQIARMLADPKSDALIDNFVGQWLTTRELDRHTPDTKVFPTWSGELAEAMRQELATFLGEFLRRDRPLLELITANATYVNARLAQHYGLKPPTGTSFTLVDGGGQRGGIVRLGATLTVTSSAVRTSPIERGKWVLQSLLCTTPPPPPAMTSLDTSKSPGTTLRQRLEAHRAAPNCAPCHAVIDPLGFGLENYDGIGRWRTRDGDGAVDASGTLPDGRTFNGPAELIGHVASDPRFVKCVARELFTYALGRGPTEADQPMLDEIAGKAQSGSFRALIARVVGSPAFRMTRGDLPGGAP